MSHVLVIDDDRLFAGTLREVIGEEGHECVVASDLATGLKLARETDFDVVFLDVVLPDGNGLDMLPWLKAYPSRPDVLVVTAAARAEDQMRAIQGGAWDYVEKGEAVRGMRLALSRILACRERRVAASEIRREGIMGGSPRFVECIELAARAAQAGVDLLITGETGTGKELLARAYHNNGPRSSGPFVVVDCASLHETITGSELFGHKRGAFTGAVAEKPGLVQLADGGTLFLDEVSEMSLEMQKSFLRVLETKQYRPLGAERELSSDFKLVSATNRDLRVLVREGRFREDLLYRLRTVNVCIPPLRERVEDLPELVAYFVEQSCRKCGLPDKIVSPELMSRFAKHDWPGNVRELAHVVEALVAASGQEAILFQTHLPRDLRLLLLRGAERTISESVSMSDTATENDALSGKDVLGWKEFRRQAVEGIESDYLHRLMLASSGCIRTAMDLSGLSQARLYGLLSKHGITLRRKSL